MLFHKSRLRHNVFFFFPFLSMLFAFATAVLAPMVPLYLQEIVTSESAIGFVFASIALLSLLFELIVAPMLERYDPLSLLKIGFVGLGVSFFVFPFIYTLTAFYLLELFRIFFFVVVMISLGLFIHASAPKGHVGDEEGAHYSFVNFAWLIGPLIGGFVAESYGVRSVFYVSGILCLLPACILSLRKRPKFRIPQQKDFTWVETVRSFFTNRSLFLLYFSALSYAGFVTLMMVFLPLYLDGLGFAKSVIGFIFFIKVLPQFLFEMYSGHLGNKYGAWKLIFIGFLFIGVFVSLLVFVESFLLLLTFLLLAYFGASLVEPNQETAFFSSIHPKDEIRYYAVYKSAVQIGALLSLGLVSTLLLFFDLLVILAFVGLYYLGFGLWCCFCAKPLKSWS